MEDIITSSTTDKDSTDMEDREDYASLQEFIGNTSTSGNLPILHNHGPQGRQADNVCLGSRKYQLPLMLIGLLASISVNIALTTHLFSRHTPVIPLDSAALALKLNSVQRRYIKLCEEHNKMGQSCTTKVQRCKECPDGWLHVGDSCYYFSKNKLDWMKSRDNCTEMGSHLTILHTMEQHDALKKEAKRIGGFDTHFWIGLSDIEEEGEWKWVDNTTLQNKYWDEWSSEPNNHQSDGEQGEDCAVLDSHSKTWFDIPCEHIAKRICQMDAIQFD